MKMSLLKNIKFQILLLSLTGTLIIFTLNKNQNNAFILPFNLRNLITNDEVIERCLKAEQKLLDKYNDTEYKIENNTFEKLDRYQEVLKIMIQEKQFGLITKYLPRIIIFAIFIIVDVLLIIFWFLFCGCSFCNKKKQTSFGGCSNFYFFLFFIFSIATIIICLYGIMKSPITYNSLNGVVCSIYKLVFHFTEGTNNEIPDSNWMGLNQTLDLIDQLNNNHIKIDKLSEDSCEGDEDKCNLYNETIAALKTDNSNVASLKEIRKETDSFIELFNNINYNTLDDIETAMKYLDKYYKLGLMILFLVLIALCFFGFISLFFYCCCSDCDCSGCLFHLFWNIEMIIIIISILIGVVFGFIGVISKDLSSIIQYALTEENLDQDTPLLFKFDKEYIKAINNSFNGDGDLYSLLFKSYNEHIEKTIKNFKEKEQTLTLEGQIKEKYDALEKKLVVFENLINNFNEETLNCSFFKKDLQILLDELKKGVSEKLTLLSLVIIIADLAAVMSIMIGISIISNYKKNAPKEITMQDKHIKMQSQGSKRNMDSSSDNLKK